PSSPFGFLQTPPLASGALAYGLSSRWLGDMGFFQPTGSANMPGKQKLYRDAPVYYIYFFEHTISKSCLIEVKKVINNIFLKYQLIHLFHFY
ncbi:MAG: hypothetical protein K9L17_10685, partial [Clostridiales bacterium]|nr:hypothetical protein [Clostridiales bacterium]MCF8023146.1 hypothetical protein [Clostridiales bacterium]